MKVTSRDEQGEPMHKKSPRISARRGKRTEKTVDWSSASRPHQVQDPQALVKRSKQARRTRKDEGGTYQDQSP